MTEAPEVVAETPSKPARGRRRTLKADEPAAAPADKGVGPAIAVDLTSDTPIAVSAAEPTSDATEMEVAAEAEKADLSQVFESEPAETPAPQPQAEPDGDAGKPKRRGWWARG